MRISLLSRLSVLAGLWVVLLTASPAAAQDKFFQKDWTDDMNIPDVVARVNGVDVDSKYVKFELNRILKDQKKPLSLLKRQRLASDIIDREINRELIYLEGRKEGYSVSPAEVQKQFEKVKASYDSEKAFEAALKRRDLTEDEIKKSIKVDLVANNLLRDKVKGKILVTDAQVEHFYKKEKESFRRPKAYRTRHIFIPHIPADVVQSSPQQELLGKMEEYSAEARKKIDAVYEKVKAGEDFSELARQYSEDVGSAEKGGDLDFIYKGVFDPAFDEAVAKLEVGEISPVVKTQYGYHIIKLIDTKPPEDVPLEELKPSIQKHLFTTEAEKMIHRYIESLRKKADVQIFYGLNR